MADDDGRGGSAAAWSATKRSKRASSSSTSRPSLSRQVPGAADVNPAVERAHGQRPADAVAERSMRSIGQTMQLPARFVQRTGVWRTEGASDALFVLLS